MDKSPKQIEDITNKVSALIEKKEFFNLELNLSENLKNIIFLYLKTDDNEYILTINNCENNIKNNFWQELKETLQIILKRAESYERNIKAISTDLLTGLDNRNSYEIRLQSLNEADNNLVYGIFDLFRLKYINDNYNHDIGDKYIKETANILKKYWPKEIIEIVNSEKHTTNTGHCIYRIGGDEFVLLTNKEEIELTKIKAKLASQEVSMINSGLKGNPIIGLNYGIVLHNPNDFIKNTYQNADKLMSEDKRKMYIKKGLDRRK